MFSARNFYAFCLKDLGICTKSSLKVLECCICCWVLCLFMFIPLLCTWFLQTPELRNVTSATWKVKGRLNFSLCSLPQSLLDPPLTIARQDIGLISTSYILTEEIWICSDSFQRIWSFSSDPRFQKNTRGFINVHLAEGIFCRDHRKVWLGATWLRGYSRGCLCFSFISSVFWHNLLLCFEWSISTL